MSTIQSYLASLKGKQVAVIGIGVSNTPLIRMLAAAGVSVTACDKRPREQFDGPLEELERLGVRLRLGSDYLDGLDQDVIFRTPGMRPDVSQLLRARERGSFITSEMEVFFSVCPCPILGVTGSDGKTTTTTILSKILTEAGRRVHVGGNIGAPLLPKVGEMRTEDLAVVELSSFQLQTMTRSPHVAVITNLSPNHLDWHTSMDEYVEAKRQIFLHQDRDDVAVFNADNKITSSLAGEARGRAVLFSRTCRLEQGVYCEDGAIWVADGQNRRRVLSTGEILLPGVHNIENYMAAIAAAQGLATDDAVRRVASGFTGVEHRLELVRELDGVRYYNDSIGTSPTRTRSGLACFERPVILIAGGYDKHIPFEELGADIVQRVRALILTGDTAQKIRAAVEAAPGYRPGRPEIRVVEDLRLAVLLARTLAGEGDAVLLSPACAAFDRFRNFMERGDAFKRIVNSL